MLAFFCLSPAKHYGESATFGGFTPFGAYGTTFPPLCGGTTTRALRCATYEIVVLRSFVLPLLAGWQGNWIRREPLGD